MGEGDLKPKPQWAKERDARWKRTEHLSGDFSKSQGEAYRARRARKVKGGEELQSLEDNLHEARPMRDSKVRERALVAVREEKRKPNDRLSAGHSERGRRARSPLERRAQKTKVKLEDGTEQEISVQERAWRLGVLLRARAYDVNYFRELPDVVEVKMNRWHEPDAQDASEMHHGEISIEKKQLQLWLDALKPYERQRLYVIGRKKLEFPFKEKDYPQWQVHDGDDAEIAARKRAKMAGERKFQKEQKELADALEVVAIPMLKGVFGALGKNVDVYLSGLPDDLAGGIDVIVEFKDEVGNQRTFTDGRPMVLVIDVTYARMRDKLTKDLDRGRICDDARDVLQGDSAKIDPALSNARAMKLFRTIVETLDGTMSKQTFGKDAPLEKPRDHVPRLIIGLDWDNAFSSIANWIEHGDEFEKSFQQTGLARRIATSVRKQLVGLHALASQDANNPNTRYLSELTDEVGTEPLRQMTFDQSLNNLDDLLTTDRGFSEKRRRNMDERELKQLNRRKKAWRLRQRLYEAAQSQVDYNRARGRRVRGDAAEEKKSAKVPEYTGGIRVEGNQQQLAIEKSPSKRAEKIVREVNDAWKNTRINAQGQRVIASKKEEIFWGDWLAKQLVQTLSWEGKERMFIKHHHPTSSASAQSTMAYGENVDDVSRDAVVPESKSSEVEKIRARLEALEILELREILKKSA